MARARRMLNEGDEIIAVARNNADPFAGKLKMALIPTIGPYLLPRVRPKLRKALPHLSLMLYEYQTEPLARLRDVKSIWASWRPTSEDGIESRVLYQEDFTVALPNNHALGGKSTIKLQDLKGHTLLLLEDGHCLRDQALEVCSRVDVREPGFSRDQSGNVASNGGCGSRHTLLPELAVESPFGSQRGLTVRRFAKPAPHRTVGAVWRKSSTRIPAIAAVGDVVERVMTGKP